MAQHQKISTILMILVVTMAALYGGAMAQSSSGCTNVLISMSPCLNYISGNTSTPSSGCCTQLASVVRSQPQCLCQVLNGGGSSLGININQAQALELPKACNVQTPPTSQCNGNDLTIYLADFKFKLCLDFKNSEFYASINQEFLCLFYK
ncbi:putative plant lipid transfer protein/Par allergen [Helianthus annuus]|nr:putative plant non-specific lipid-transfer protein/Par allergen [Helianthus annuus]KAJ0623906.1 putative plant lipid transfer protein/Par allergen [Helianthus annuus]KAJ0627792.1 putative plant non-specific lipid-transfer protein/Par allergen [Helianthus annuus]KAJ0784083.1 putative plant non-specific lipid-transfer protein/Par allergen [Helianthus annuus]KAJ0949068.1 putative plant lipid transfer protein/Par allergen [Helianthus annuus]